jgi:hypothetical protein
MTHNLLVLVVIWYVWLFKQGEVEIYFEINGSGTAIDSSYWKRQLRQLSPQYEIKCLFARALHTDESQKPPPKKD